MVYDRKQVRSTEGMMQEDRWRYLTSTCMYSYMYMHVCRLHSYIACKNFPTHYESSLLLLCFQ